MDIDQLMYTAVSKDNDRETLTNFLMSQGPRESANEHLIPEQLFDDPSTDEKEVEGVSAVKALQIAASEGQTIYTITQENYAQVLPKLSLSGTVMSDINNAINSGKQVTVHEHNINFKGWNGSGYIIIDLDYGTGAYLIDGGANGAIVMLITSFLIIGIAPLFIEVNPILFAGLLMVGVGLATAAMGILTQDEGLCDTGMNIVLAGVGIMLAAVGLPTAVVKGSATLAGGDLAALAVIQGIFAVVNMEFSSIYKNRLCLLNGNS